MFARNALLLVAAGFAAAQTTNTETVTGTNTNTDTVTLTGTTTGVDTTQTATGTVTLTNTETTTGTERSTIPTMSTSITHGNGTYTTTRVVSAYTTYCPGPTTFDFNGHHYEIHEATTLTITDCPCTIVEPCDTPGGVAPTHVPVPPSKPVNGGGSEGEGSKGSEGEGEGSKGTEGGEAPVHITSGAGAMQLSFGLAAIFGLLAL